jgi:predicted amino acid-binding ACT domain protein
LPTQQALKIPLLDIRKQKLENVRAALNRAGKKVGLQIATSSDDYFFYVWIDNKDIS